MFGQKPVQENEESNEYEPDVDNPTQCHLCAVKNMEIKALKENNKKQMEKVQLWYEEQASKEKETFLKRLKDQQKEIDSLVEENNKLKAREKEPDKARTGFHADDMCTQPGSIVAQAISCIVGKFYLDLNVYHCSRNDGIARSFIF